MIRLLATLNSFIGVIALTFYALHAGAGALSPDRHGLIFLGVGGTALAAAGMGFKRLGILFHGLAFSQFVALASAVGLQETPTRSLQAVFAGLADHWPLAAAGLASIALASLVDQRRFVKKSPTPEATPRPPAATASTAKPASTSSAIHKKPARPVAHKKTTAVPAPADQGAKARIEDIPEEPDRKKVICACGKRLRVKATVRNIRCPACNTVINLS